MIYVAGSDYLRISWHPRVRAALVEAVSSEGPTTGASRMTTGNRTVYRDLETAAQGFFGSGVATLTSAGYLAPLVAAQALAATHSHVLLARGAHACLQDAARLSGLPTREFAAQDPSDLLRVWLRCGRQTRALVLTEGLSPTSGRIFPVAEFLAVLPPGSTLLVDDSHGVGVLGAHGRGTLETQRVDRRRVVLTFTLSKAFGAYGGLILGTPSLARHIQDLSGIHTGNTPLPPPLAAAGVAAFRVMICEGADRRARLLAGVARLKEAFAETGHAVPEGPGPVIAVAPPHAPAARRLERRLLDAGVHPPRIRYPGGPADSFFRFALSSEHTLQQVDIVRSVLVDYLRQDAS